MDEDLLNHLRLALELAAPLYRTEVRTEALRQLLADYEARGTALKQILLMLNGEDFNLAMISDVQDICEKAVGEA